jgi:hypothetical protein
MDITEMDKSNYLKGFLILIGNAGSINESNKNLIRNVASILEYNHYFVEHSINELSENNNQVQDLPKFSSHSFAEIFIRDSMRLTFNNNILNLDAIRWLLKVIQINNLSRQWFYLELENFLDNYNSDKNCSFEIQKHVKEIYN